MAMAATGIDRNGDVAKLEFKSSPKVSMDGSQTLDSCDEDIPVPTMETSIETSSKSSLHDEMKGETDYDFPESVEIDENLITNVIEEICPVDGPCVQCQIEQPCSFRFTDNGQTLYVCNKPCIKAYQTEYPGKYSVTRMKYIIEEITPKTFLCSECEQNKTCYFYHTYDGEETYYCSLNCLDGMMADEKDKYTFKLNNVHICINQIRPKEGQCLICEKVKPCEFSMVRYGETCFLCERTCIKVLSVREHGRYYISKQRVNIPAVTTALDNQLDEGYNIQAKAAAMAQREQSFHRRCSQCTLILMIDENVLTWEAMDFCDEICLERFQKGIGSKCAKCESLVQRTSLGKYCVRFGYDVRQFCNSSCLEEFKNGLKICCYCQRDISASTQVFLAPVGDKGQLKDFCAQACAEKFDQMSRNPKPQPVWAKCAVCSLEKATTIEMEVSETDSQRLCSDTCFAAFTFAKNIVPDQCKWCKKYFERKPTQSFTTYDDDSNPNCFCSLSCMTIHIHHTRFLVSCNKCKLMKYNIDMIRRADNDQAVMMCSLSCLNLYQESVNAQSANTGAPASTLATPIPSIEQGRADVITLAAEQLITLTQTRKRCKTTQSSKQEEPQIINLEKLSSVISDSPASGRKKEARSSRLAAEQLISTLNKSRKRRATTQSSKQEESQINKSAKISPVITDSQPSGKMKAGSSRKKSPERQPCIMAEASSSRSAEPSEELERGGQPSIMAEASSSRSAEPSEELERGGQTSIMAEASTSRSAEPSEELERGGQTSIMAEASTSRSAEPSEELERGGQPSIMAEASSSRSAEMSSDGARDSDNAGNNVKIPVHSYVLTPRGTLSTTGSLPVLAVVRSEEQERPTASQGASDVAVAGGSGWPSSSRGRPRARRSLPNHDERIANILADSGSEDDNTDDDEEELSNPTRLRKEFNDSRQEVLERENERVESGEERTNYEYLEDMEEEMNVGMNEEMNVGMNVDESRPRVSTEFQWSDDFTSFSGQKETYRREPGPTVQSQDPTEIFLQIWDEHIMGLIADETNCYARQIIEMFTDPELDTHIPKYLEQWEEVTIPVMYQYFAAMIFMSFCVRTKIQEYWEMNRLEMPKFREIMTRDKFLLITKFLHFVSDRESTARGYARKIGKVAPILDHCNRKFSALYIPAQHISLDESLLLWKGRLSWRQCIRSKAARFGIKSFDLCEATSGYLLKCKLYTGKETPMHSGPLHGFSNKSAQVVLDLMEGYLDAGHVLVMDNWYNQLYLTRYLKSRGTDVLGTLNRTLKDVPQELKDLKQNQVARGEWHARHSGDIALVTWKDVKLVTVMSTYHDHQMVPGRLAGGREKPVSVREYNKYMGGVDLKDQKLSTFLFERKRGHKWYMKVFRRFVNTSLLNAFIIYTKNPMYRLCSHREFRFAVAEGLLARFGTTRGALPPSVSITVHQALRLQPGTHFPVYTEKLPNKAEHRKRYCERCKMVKKRSQVRTMCSLCQVPLCIGQCWTDYHSCES